jgi:hypothetical protein
MKTKNILIGAGVLVVGYLLLKKNQRMIGATDFKNFKLYSDSELKEINLKNGYCQNPSPNRISSYNCYKDGKGNTWIKKVEKGIVYWLSQEGKTYDDKGNDITIIYT